MVAGVVNVSARRADGISWFELRSCRDKVRLDSRAEARLAAHGIERREGDRLQPYHCRFCGHWHVGHPTRRRR